MPHHADHSRYNGPRHRRPAIPSGDSFISRLGPIASEPFASLDDVDPATTLPPPSPDTPIDQLRFVAVDCETTGQSPHRMVEIGAVLFTASQHLMSFETL